MKNLVSFLLALACFSLWFSCKKEEDVTGTQQPEETGAIAVFSDPSGASISLDGKSTGSTTPDTLTDISVGDHAVQLLLHGYLSWVDTVSVVADQITVVNATLIVGQWSTPVNLGPAINSDTWDQHPSLTSDGNTIYFDRHDEDIYFSTGAGSQWQTATLVGPPVSDPSYHESSPSISAGGNTLYFTRIISWGGHPDNGIYCATKQGTTWQNPVRLPFSVHDFGPCISSDGNTLYFARWDSVTGDTDIYVATKIGDTWQSPMPIGSPINTPDYSEYTPSISRDGQVLYFASDRPGGYGNLDIWVSNKIGDQWQEPVNLGDVINTATQEEGPFISPDGQALYFESSSDNWPGGQGDTDIWVSIKQ